MQVIVPLHYYLIVAAALFSIGVAVIITKRNAIAVLIGIELILNAVNLNLVAFSQYDPVRLSGQMLTLFVMVIAAAESAVALAILLKVYRYYQTADLDKISSMKK
ncbi:MULTISPECIES: NADH-quinone oxidoreductase subunit NuoK [Runella]|uniref:NADH-quinone oxidoreductase subunit K n=1 Tax=Runella defluvii TaxID=370973 RepID=A0A7W5ZM07_9BACT|nr:MULTISPECIES: NADH-quinone oxidoreductase subunit NuoK [Runella]MBB3838197.1 NADH-quinone oxidoreductase subunit K [Runella defluvii]HAK76798.1 NADH-quinone oxidoreductase subunit NuoK [Runella sp.]HAO48899.1 NADH-quinone oxidoreductase subunit NuoK [Runella sp.]